MSRGAKYTCPVHGLTDCHAMADGFYCLADGPGGPDADEVCGLRCDFPMQMEDGRIYRTQAELLAGERTDPGPGRALPRRGRALVVKKPRQKAAKGPPSRRAADPSPNTDHETTPRHAPEGAAEAKENAMPPEKLCEQCEKAILAEDLAGSNSRKSRKRCAACAQKVPADYWAWAKKGRTLDEARALAARYSPGRKTPAKRAAAKKAGTCIASVEVEVVPSPPLVLTDDGDGPQGPFPSGHIDLGHFTQEEVEADLREAAKTLETFTDDGPAHPLLAPKGILGCLYALEETQARTGALIAELRRIVMGESA